MLNASRRCRVKDLEMQGEIVIKGLLIFLVLVGG